MKLKIKNPFKMLSEHFENNRRKEAIAQVNRDVQLREFEGKIYLCYNNVPIVEESQLKDTLCNTITDTRAAVCRYAVYRNIRRSYGGGYKSEDRKDFYFSGCFSDCFACISDNMAGRNFWGISKQN